jgi:hypothetical protein
MHERKVPMMEGWSGSGRKSGRMNLERLMALF